jgi:predicted dehydrogenase
VKIKVPALTRRATSERYSHALPRALLSVATFSFSRFPPFPPAYAKFRTTPGNSKAKQGLAFDGLRFIVRGPSPMYAPLAGTPVVFGIVSPAHWGRKLLDAARDTTSLRFAGVFSRDPVNAADVVREYGGSVYSSYAALLADPLIDAVLLPTPHFAHREQAELAFAAGKHVFVEKPIATTIADAELMRDAARAAGRVLAVGHQGRRTGAARKARALITAGDIGRIVHLVAVQGFPTAFGWGPENWRRNPALLPGGPLDELGVHYFDLMRYLAGPITHVAGWQVSDVTAGGVPDAATAALRFASGAIASYTTHFVSVGISQLTIYGTKGLLQLNGFGQELLRQMIADPGVPTSMNPGLERLPVDGPQPFTTALTGQFEDFARCIREGGEPEIGAREAIAALRVSRAVLESARSGRSIELPPEP